MLKLKIQNILSAIFNSWNNFWFKPVSTKPLACFRIFFGLFAIQYAVLLAPDLFIWLGQNGIVSSASINGWHPHIRFNILNLFPDNDIWLSIIFVTFCIACICLTLGFFTRISAITVFLGLLSFHSRNYLIINSGDSFMRLLSFWMIFSPAGNSYSIDHWLKTKQKKQTDDMAPWAQRLMQVNMALVYGHTFFKKIIGIDWQNGTAIYFSSHFTEMHRLPIVYIFDHLWTVKLLTWTTLVVEFSLCFLIWFKPIRYYVIALGIIMHLVIDWSMLIPQFEWIMIASYILFIEPDDLQKLFTCFRTCFKQLLKKSHFV